MKLGKAGGFLETGILILSGVMLIGLGSLGVHMYNTREDPGKETEPHLERSREAALFFIGIGIGSLFTSVESGIDKFKHGLSSRLMLPLVLLALGGLAIYTIVEGRRAFEKLGKGTKAEKVERDLEAPQWVIAGLGFGYLIAVVIREIGKATSKTGGEGQTLIGRIIGLYFLVLTAAAAGVNINIYTSTGKKSRTGVIVSSILLVLAILAFIGDIVTLIFAPE